MKKSVYLLGCVGFIAILTAIASCDGLNNECLDGLDNDADGLVDASDPACIMNQQVAAQRAANCVPDQAGIPYDNPACASFQASSESDDPACADGEDNDQDGIADFPNDPGCSSATDTNETNGECADGIDNDGNGLRDRQDFGCSDPITHNYDPRRVTERSPFACSDGVDNDADNAFDYPRDVGCADPYDDDERNPECSDGIDNDGDGRIDLGGDPDCS